MDARVNTISDPRPEAEVDCACAHCTTRRFGRYVLVAEPDGSIIPVDPAGRPFYEDHRPMGVLLARALGTKSSSSLYWEPRYGWTRRRKGPRTGTGLHLETFGGRLYVRVICKCGPRNEKLGMAQLDKLMFDDEGELRLRDGVLYL